MPRTKTVYAVYKGDEFVDVGTLNELSARSGIQSKTILFRMSPTYKKRCRGLSHFEVFKLT